MIILASASPRRQELLKKIIKEFSVVAANVDETPTRTCPKGIAKELAERKALCVFNGNDTVIASDTIVVFKKKVLGKPQNRNDALNTLSTLNGKWHKVITGVCIVNLYGKTVFSVQSKVKFKKMSTEQIERYIDDFKPYDKAGSYGIQDGVCVDKIVGSYDNIMGLPTEKLSKYFKEKIWHN